MTTNAEPDFTPASALAASPGGTGGDDPGYVPGVDLDRWKRYLLPVPGSDPADLQPYTRVTTLTGMLTSQDGLRVWSERNIVRGVGLRADLRAAITADPDDKSVQDEVIRVAKEVTEDGAAARHGRAVHRGVETLSAGTPEERDALATRLDPAEPLGRDVLAAMECLAQNGIRVRMVERLVVHPMCRYAGRLDALWEVTLPDGQVRLRIGDVKTGKDLHKPEKRHPMGAQLGGYVNAQFMYEPATRTFTPIPPELDRSVGYILAVRDGTAQLYEIDLIAGWQRMLTAVKLHRDRKASVDMLPVGQPVTIQYAEPAPAPDLSSLRPVVQWEPHGTVQLPAEPPMTIEQMAVGIAAIRHPDTDQVEDELLIPPGQPVPDGAILPGASLEPADVERSPSGRARRACSKCRKRGHTAKKCPGSDMGGADAGDDQQLPAQAVQICPHANGWTQRQSDGAWVCADCGRPSEATVAAMRTGAPLPVGVEGGATVARLDPAPEAPSGAPSAPPWSAPAAPKSLIERVHEVKSQEELGQLWQANQGEWGAEHTELAQQLVAEGLPLMPPTQ